MRNHSLNKRALGLATLVAGLFIGPSQAEARKLSAASATPDPASITMPDPANEPSQSTFDALFKAIKQKRGPSSVAVPTEADLGADFIKFRDEFLNVTTPDQLDAFIVKHNAPEAYQKHPANVKFIVTHLALLQPYRSVIYRLRDLFETKTDSVHSMSVTALKSTAAALKVVLPTQQWEAGFKYITTPSAGPGLQKFGTVAEFQAFLQSTAGHWENAIKRTTALLNNIGTGPLVFDNQIAYGTASFGDNLDRFRLIDSAELYTILAGQHMAQYQVSMFVAYNHDQSLEVAEDLGRLAGVNGFLTDGVAGALTRVELGVAAHERVEKVLRKDKFRNFLVLRGKYGRAAMARAHFHLKKATEYSYKAWKLVDARPVNQYHAIQTGVVQAKRRHLAIHHENANALVNGVATVKSPITGEAVEFNLPAFFDPRTVPVDLKAFLPPRGGFDRSPETDYAQVEGKRVPYRNYFRGRAIAWNNEAFAPYVPSAKGKSPDYMEKALNTLALSYEGGMLFGPVYTFIR